MSQPRQVVPAEQYEMARRVLWLLNQHLLLQPLRAEGAQIRVGCHTRAVFAIAVTSPGDDHPLSTEVEHPQWWVPQGERWVERLAQRLAVGLRNQWEERSAVGAA